MELFIFVLERAFKRKMGSCFSRRSERDLLVLPSPCMIIMVTLIGLSKILRLENMREKVSALPDKIKNKHFSSLKN